MKPEVVSQLQGSTDSEHMAGLYISNLGDTEVAHSIEDMRNALLATIKTVLEVQKAVLKPEQLQNNGGASSLNLCACMLSRSVSAPSLLSLSTISTTGAVSSRTSLPFDRSDIDSPRGVDLYSPVPECVQFPREEAPPG